MRGAVTLLLGVLAATPAPAEPPASPAEAPPVALQQRHGDTRTEQALRRVLGVLMQQYGDLTGKVPEALNDADIAMREAGQALDAGDDAAAAASLRRAIEALQKGGRSMSQQLSQQFGGEGEDGDESDDGQMAGEQDGSQPGDEEGRGRGAQFGRNGRWDGRWDGRRPADRRADDRRDPLGRPLREDGTGQSPDDSGVRVPEEMEQARSHAIQEELRRREAEKTRPQPELDYIERLLRQF